MTRTICRRMPRRSADGKYSHVTRTMLIGAASVIAGLLVAGAARGEAPIELMVRGGHVFDTAAGTFHPNPGIAVQHGRFVQAAEAAQVIQLTDDQYILPGIIDCHAHYNVRLIKRRREEFQWMPLLYLANGATVTFSAGEYDPHGMLELRRRIEAGEQIGPRLITSGPYFGTARRGWRAGRSEQEIRDEVDYWVARGAGGFKAKGIDPESLRVLIDQAHQHGRTVTGHLDSGYRNSVNPRDAITLGIDRIEHFLGGDAMPASQSAYQSLPDIRSGTPEFAAICEHFVKHQVDFDCTLTAYGYFDAAAPTNTEIYEYWIDERAFFTPYMRQVAAQRAPASGMEIYQRIFLAKLATIADFHRAGGHVTLGTDHVSDGNFLPGFGIHRELQALVMSGIPAADALRIGTIQGARALRIDDDHGSIEIGKVADLLVISGNPLEDIRHTRRVQLVLCRGKPYDPAELLRQAQGQLGPQSAAEAAAW